MPPVSFDAISTELDTRILSFMEHDCLEAMSRVSKYYRAVAEPYLYRYISIEARDSAQMKLLFLALVTRPVLTSHIETFETYDSSGSEIDVEREYFSQQLLGRITNIQGIVNQFLGQRSASEVLEWLASAIQPKQHVVDTYVGLILSLAKNVECIKLFLKTTTNGENHFAKTSMAIALPWMLPPLYINRNRVGDDGVSSLPIGECNYRPGPAETTQTTTVSKSFSKLRHMRIAKAFNAAIPVVPSLQDIQVRDSFNITIAWPAIVRGGTNLNKIDFGSCELPADCLINGLNAGLLKNVQVVRFVNTLSNMRLAHHRVADAMAVNIPDLEYMEWVNFTTGAGGRPIPGPLRTLTRFLRLTTLRIEFNLVSESTNFPAFTNPKSVLPPNLHTLHLSSIDLRNLDRQLKSLTGNERDHWVDCILNLTETFPLCNLSMTVKGQGQDYSKIPASTVSIGILQEVEERLSAMGTHFAVYRTVLGDDTVSPHLLGPGFVSDEWDLYDRIQTRPWLSR